jgi:hypothetical protein
MQSDLGEADYRKAGLERLDDSFVLLQSQKFSGSVYLGGRAVESMLRAVIWKHDVEIRGGRQSLETGHDLRELLGRVMNLGVVHEAEVRDELAFAVQRLARVWLNNMRFHPTSRVEKTWRKLGEVGKRRTIKQAVLDFYLTCSIVVKRCEALCV